MCYCCIFARVCSLAKSTKFHFSSEYLAVKVFGHTNNRKTFFLLKLCFVFVLFISSCLANDKVNTARFWKEAIFVFSHFIWGNSRFAINKKAILFYRLTGSTGQYHDLMEPFIFHYIKLCLFLSVGLYIVEDNGYDKLPQKNFTKVFFPDGEATSKTKQKTTIMECISGQNGRSQIWKSEANVP